MPLPPLAEQKRIVARIDALFAEIDEGEAALTQARQGLETFRLALLKSAVTGELTEEWRGGPISAESATDFLASLRERYAVVPNGKGKRKGKMTSDLGADSLPPLPPGWDWARLSELGAFGRGKSRHRPRDDARLYGGGMPFIQTGNVSNSDDYIVSYQQTYSQFGIDQSKVWPGGTLCITIAANIAKTAITTFDACFPDSIVGLVPHPGVDPYWVHMWLQTIQKRLERFAPATAQKNINLEVLNSVFVPIPPPKEHAEIRRRVSEALSASATARVLFDSEVNDVSRLKQSVLKYAFEGKLAERSGADLAVTVSNREGDKVAAPLTQTTRARVKG